jgi:succinoglycan biosynthesis protein ExoV
MRLHYYRALPNFGDRLNPWLWPKLLPGAFSSRTAPDDTVFLGIGTILQASVPPAAHYVVLGAGCGYGSLPHLDERWEFFAVRGPLTAQSLDLPAALAVTDPAYLIRLLPPPPPRRGLPVGFMPHWRSLRHVPWRGICEWSGLRFIHPFAPVERVLSAIAGCRCIIAEAMHAAIVADALRVPWLPVRIGADFLDFKWRDWLASIEVDARPVPLTSMDPIHPHRPGESRARKNLRNALNLVSYYARSAPLIRDFRSLTLRLAANRQPLFLSSDRVVRERTAALESRLTALRDSLAAPTLSPHPQIETP